MATIFDLLILHREQLLAALARHRAHSLRVFGSVARGEERPDSDVDFLVDFEPDASLLDLIGLKEDFEAVLGRPADIVTAEGVSPFLRDRILKEAVPV
jgi:predicted nucleotidyltransferase